MTLQLLYFIYNLRIISKGQATAETRKYGPATLEECKDLCGTLNSDKKS